MLGISQIHLKLTLIAYINCKACDSVSCKLCIQSKSALDSLVEIIIEKKGEHDLEKPLKVLANNNGSATTY